MKLVAKLSPEGEGLGSTIDRLETSVSAETNWRSDFVIFSRNVAASVR